MKRKMDTFPSKNDPVLAYIGSMNPVKRDAARIALSKFFETVSVEGHAVKTCIPAQPFHDDTLSGAKERARALYRKFNGQDKKADFYIGLEGGITQKDESWFCIRRNPILSTAGAIPETGFPRGSRSRSIWLIQ